MPDNPFDRVIINPREKPLSEDVNVLQSQLDRALRYFAKSMFSTSAGAPQSGFLAGGLKAVEATVPAMEVVLKAGLGFQDDPTDVPSDIDTITGLDDIESYKPLVLPADLTVAIPVAPGGPNDRTDIIEVRADRLATNNINRDIFDTTSETFSAALVNKTLEFLLDGSKQGAVISPAASTAAISLKQGVAGTPGAVPSTTAGYIKIAEVFVDSAVSVINDADITDSRVVLAEANLKSAVFDPQEIYIPAGACTYQRGGGGDADYNVDVWFSVNATNFQIGVPISAFIKKGQRILSIRAYLKDTVGNLVNIELYEVAMPGSTPVSISDAVDSDNSGVAQSVDLTGISFNAGTNILEANKTYHLEVERLAAPTLIQFYGVKVEFDQPQ